MVTELELKASSTKHLSYFLRLCVQSFATQLLKNKKEFSDISIYDKLHCVRIKEDLAFGYVCNNHIYFNIENIESKIRGKSVFYISSLLVSIFAHEFVHGIIDKRFFPPLKEVQDSLNKYYNKKDHIKETLPCYFSLALLGYKSVALELFKFKKKMLSQFFFLRNSINRDVCCFLNRKVSGRL